jgi:hypothetical protein
VPGTIRARAMQVEDPATSCDVIRASMTGGITNATFSLSPSLPTPPPQIESSYVAFNNANPGLYTIIPQTPPGSGYVIAGYCWKTTIAPTSEGLTQSATLASADTLLWDIKYTLGTPWAQAQGGDVYASGILKSYVPESPPLPAPRAFILDGAGGYPGGGIDAEDLLKACLQMVV